MDETIGESINSVMSSSLVVVDGWRVATNYEMAILLNDFVFGATFFWDTDENTRQVTFNDDGLVENMSIDPEKQFVALFGQTNLPDSSVNSPDDPWEATAAWYGLDKDEDGLIGYFSALDDYTNTRVSQHFRGHVTFSEDIFPLNSQSLNLGVALVKTIPEPTSLFWFSLGLLLIFRIQKNTLEAFD